MSTHHERIRQWLDGIDYSVMNSGSPSLHFLAIGPCHDHIALAKATIDAHRDDPTYPPVKIESAFYPNPHPGLLRVGDDFFLNYRDVQIAVPPKTLVTEDVGIFTAFPPDTLCCLNQIMAGTELNTSPSDLYEPYVEFSKKIWEQYRNQLRLLQLGINLRGFAFQIFQQLTTA